jgi:hypothetical protein
MAAAIEALARLLFETMQHLEPWTDKALGELGDDDREFYPACIEAMECRPALLEPLLEADT